MATDDTTQVQDTEEEKKQPYGPPEDKAYEAAITPMPAPSIQSAAQQAPAANPPTITAPMAAPSPVTGAVAAGPLSPGEAAIHRLSGVQQQNPFAVLMARSENISNPFLRVLAKAGGVAGAGLEGLSKDYPAIEQERIAEANQPGEAAARAAQTEATTAHTAGEKAQTAALQEEAPVKLAGEKATTAKTEAETAMMGRPTLLTGADDIQIVGQGTPQEQRFDRYKNPDGSTQWVPEGQAPVWPPQQSAAGQPAAGGGTGGAPAPAAGPAGPQVPAAGPRPGALPAGATRIPAPVTPAEQAELAPVGAEAEQYNKRIAYAVGDKAADFQVTPQTPRKQADAIEAQAKSQGTLDVSQANSKREANTAAANLARQPDARLDRSYQFNATQLDKERVPIEAMMGKISAATTNVNLKSPQADALLAPEILSIAAGGAGSGLRMNEAEISRIVGGATQWTQLQTALNKWSTDPGHATFTPEQRGQMAQILDAAKVKGQQKMAVIEYGEQALNDATDVSQHRSTVANTRKMLDAVDNGKTIERNKKTGELRIAPGQ